MVHVPAKFRENTSMRFWVTVQKVNVTDRRTDRRTDRQTDGGRCNISRPGPSAPREIIIICRNRHSYQRGWMPHKRETQMVCNLHFPRGLRISEFLEFGIEGHFRRENQVPVSWLDEKLSLLLLRPGREPTTSRTPRLHNKQGVPHPTCSAIYASRPHKLFKINFTPKFWGYPFTNM